MKICIYDECIKYDYSNKNDNISFIKKDDIENIDVEIIVMTNNKNYNINISNKKIIIIESNIDLLNLNIFWEISKIISKKREDNIFIVNVEINNIIKNNNEYISLKKIIDEINLITKKLNKEKKHDIMKQLRFDRHILMKNIIHYINDNEHFILPYIFPYKYVSKNIAIIGNSKKLLKKENGAIINEFKNVFRLNYAVTSGFETYCGSKNDIRLSSIRAINCVIDDRIPKGMEDYELYKKINDKNIIVYINPNLNYTYFDIINMMKKNETNIDKNIYMLQWDKNNFNCILNYFNEKISMDPQLGFGILLLVIDLGLVPHIFGFDIEYSSDNYGYYWSGNIVHENISPYHIHHEEHAIIKNFTNNNYVIYNDIIQ